MPPRINIPPLTRGLLVSLVVLSFLNAGARYRSWQVDRTTSVGSRQYYAPYLTIIPGMSVAYPWVFLTATLAEQNLFGLLFTGVTLFYGGRYLERAWSSTEYMKFIALISGIPNVLTFLIYVSAFVITKDPRLTSTSISGGISIQAAFVVAFKQLVPEHTVSLLRGLIRIRVKHFPAIFLLGNTISGILFGTDTAAILSWLGFLTSWTYLRFYRASPLMSSSATGGGVADSDGAAAGPMIRGDASDTFAFAYFWPDAVHVPIAKVCDAVWEVLVAVRVCAPFSDEDVDAGNEQAMARGESGHLPSLLNSIGGSGLAERGRGLLSGGGGGGSGRSGSRREEAERRRALALRALDQRLHAAAGRPPSATPAQPGRVVSNSSNGDTESNGGAGVEAKGARESSPEGTGAPASGGGGMLGETEYRPDDAPGGRGRTDEAAH